MPVIGFLIPPPAAAEGTLRALAAFRRGLAEADNVEGKNLAIEYRFANFRPELIPELAADVVRLNMKGIFAAAPEAVTAVRNATAYRCAGFGERSCFERTRTNLSTNGLQRNCRSRSVACLQLPASDNKAVAGASAVRRLGKLIAA
jgi:hypothetical protein